MTQTSPMRVWMGDRYVDMPCLGHRPGENSQETGRTNCMCHVSPVIQFAELSAGCCRECGCPKTREAFERIYSAQQEGRRAMSEKRIEWLDSTTDGTRQRNIQTGSDLDRDVRLEVSANDRVTEEQVRELGWNTPVGDWPDVRVLAQQLHLIGLLLVEIRDIMLEVRDD